MVRVALTVIAASRISAMSSIKDLLTGLRQQLCASFGRYGL